MKVSQGILICLFLFFLTPHLFGIEEISTLTVKQTETDIWIHIDKSDQAKIRIPLNKPFIEVKPILKKDIKYSHGSFQFDFTYAESETYFVHHIIQYSDSIVFVNKNKKPLATIYRNSNSGFSIKYQDPFSRDNVVIRTPFLIDESEYIFGGGEQFSHVNLNGNRIPIWVEEQGIGRGDQPITFLANTKMAGGNEFTTFFPLPLFWTSTFWGLNITSTSKTILDFTGDKTAFIEYFGSSFQADILYECSPKEIVKTITKLNGKPQAFAPWTSGTVLGLQGGSDRVLEVYKKCLENEVRPSAIWIQDWCGQRKTPYGWQLNWNWQLDTNHYSNFISFSNTLKENGTELLGYVNPFLAEGFPLTKIALDSNYVIHNKKNEPYLIEATGFYVYILDLTNPDAVAWMKSIIQTELIDRGFTGWMADFGEWLPTDCVLHSGIDAFEYHNQYPVDWAKLNYESIKEKGKLNEISFFSRSGFTGSTQYSPLIWAGDQMTNWGKHDGLPSVLPALLSSGLSGIPNTHFDVGGFTSASKGPVSILRDEELLKRWIEISAFSPVFRTHESILSKKNIQVYDDSMIDFFSIYSWIRNLYLPIIERLQKEAIQDGIPISRHMLLEFPHDEICYSITDQFMLGENLLIAPIVNKGEFSRHVYLPEGQWLSFDGQNDVTYEGGKWYVVPAPLGRIPVFTNNHSGIVFDK